MQRKEQVCMYSIHYAKVVGLKHQLAIFAGKVPAITLNSVLFVTEERSEITSYPNRQGLKISDVPSSFGRLLLLAILITPLSTPS